MNSSTNGINSSPDSGIQEIFRLVQLQRKEQEEMYQDLKLIFQELIQQKVERQNFIQKQESTISEIYRAMDDKFQSLAQQITAEITELKSSMVKKIENQRGYLREAKELKDSMMSKLEEEKSYLKDKIREVQKDLMSRITGNETEQSSQLGDEGGGEVRRKLKSHKSKLSWFTKRGEHRRGAEYEQNDEGFRDAHVAEAASPDMKQQDNLEPVAQDVKSTSESHDSDSESVTAENYVDNSDAKIVPVLQAGSSDSNENVSLKVNESKFQQPLEHEDLPEKHENKDSPEKTTKETKLNQTISDVLSQISADNLVPLCKLQQLIKDSCQLAQQDVLDSLEDKLTRAVRTVEASLTMAKQEISDVVEKESQLVRDKISFKYKPRTSYVFDFYVKYIRDMIKRSESQLGPPWFIDQLNSSVKGYVETIGHGDMYVALMYGRHPTAVGLLLRCGVKLKVKATIKDVMGDLPDVVVGEVTWSCDESGVKDNRLWGKKIGVVPCRSLLYKGYGEKEGYAHCAMLIRYDISVC